MLAVSVLIFLIKKMIQRVLFNESECAYLRSFVHKSEVVKTSSPARGNFNTTVAVIPPSDIPVWFKNKIKVFKVKEFLFENKLASSRAVIINSYGKNGYFARHRDDYALEDHWTKRYKTLIVQLSNSSDYIGGDLLVDDHPVDRTLGNTILFNASTYHELTKIKQGERYSLILWLDRDDIIEKKELL